MSSALHIPPSDAATFPTDAYSPPALITAFALDNTGDPCGTYRLAGTSGECLLAWCILFVSAEEWSAKYVAALLPVPSNMASF